MNINQNVNISGVVTIKVNDKDVPALNLSANIDTLNKNCAMAITTLNKDLVNADTAAEIQKQIDEFKVYVQGKAKELGFAVVL